MTFTRILSDRDYHTAKLAEELAEMAPRGISKADAERFETKVVETLQSLPHYDVETFADAFEKVVGLVTAGIPEDRPARAIFEELPAVMAHQVRVQTRQEGMASTRAGNSAARTLNSLFSHPKWKAKLPAPLNEAFERFVYNKDEPSLITVEFDPTNVPDGRLTGEQFQAVSDHFEKLMSRNEDVRDVAEGFFIDTAPSR